MTDSIASLCFRCFGPTSVELVPTGVFTLKIKPNKFATCETGFILFSSAPFPSTIKLQSQSLWNVHVVSSNSLLVLSQCLVDPINLDNRAYLLLHT